MFILKVGISKTDLLLKASPYWNSSALERGGASVTICVAALFRWNYGSVEQPDWGRAAIAISDRMITAGDVQYEPQQLKVAFVTDACVILIAGDYALHSQALKETHKEISSLKIVDPQEIAIAYGRSIKATRQRQAESLYLAPLGLTMKTFLDKQKDMSQDFISNLTGQIQNYRGDAVEAIVIGSDGEAVQAYVIDFQGNERCIDDVGFAAIGTGAWHAQSRLMQAGYTNSATLAPALAAAYAAKRSSEVAPGVGSQTDIHLVMKNVHFPLWTSIKEQLEKLYGEYERSRLELAEQGIAGLQKFLDGYRVQESSDSQGVITGDTKEDRRTNDRQG